MDNLEREVRELIAQGQKIEAIKKVREAKRLSLKDAKDYVDILIRPLSSFSPSGEVSEETLEFEVRELLARGRKIEAIKKVRELTDWGLKEAKDFVDSIEWS
jgi:ribosomal protein L7/L12